MADIKEREAARARQEYYRQELEKQTAEARNRINESRRAEVVQEENMQKMKMGSIKTLENNEEEKEKKKRIIAINIMDENMRSKIQAVKAIKETERIETQEMMENIKRSQEQEKIKEEREKLNKARIANALKMSYDVQENIKRQEAEKEKELDKMYCERHREKLMQDDQYRQKVIHLYILVF